jgi:hypothetical protein
VPDAWTARPPQPTVRSALGPSGSLPQTAGAGWPMPYLEGQQDYPYAIQNALAQSQIRGVCGLYRSG